MPAHVRPAGGGIALRLCASACSSLPSLRVSRSRARVCLLPRQLVEGGSGVCTQHICTSAHLTHIAHAVRLRRSYTWQLVEGGSDMLQLMNLLAFCMRTFAQPKN